jgi:hypothetical protein
MRRRDQRRRRRQAKTHATAERVWSAPPARPDLPRASMDCRCPHVWVRTEFSPQLDVEQATKTYECRECSVRLVRIADGLPGSEPELYCIVQGSFVPCRWDACITAHRSLWRKISDGVRAENWRGDAHQHW